MQQPKFKSRDISVGDLFTNLQLEYISYRVRSLIYTRLEDKKKFNDICLKKREKIEAISTKNCLPVIFSNKKSQEKYLKSFFKEWGLPNFQYRDDYKKKVYGWWDPIYYFKDKVDIKYNNKGDIVLGVISRYDAHRNLITINIDNKLILTETQLVSRIFSESFFNKIFE
jgi:hypothetical protein